MLTPLFTVRSSVSPSALRVPVYRMDSGLVWVNGLACDADGSKTVYAPLHSGLPALDDLGNAHKDPHDLTSPWCGAVLRPDGTPYIDDDGYYVSPTSLEDTTKDPWDHARYVPADIVPFLVRPESLHHAGVGLADVGILWCRQTNKYTAYLVADDGPDHLTEASIAACAALGVPDSPKNGGTSHGVTALVFPGSAKQPGWPQALSDVQMQAEALLAAWGGLARLKALAL